MTMSAGALRFWIKFTVYHDQWSSNFSKSCAFIEDQPIFGRLSTYLKGSYAVK